MSNDAVMRRPIGELPLAEWARVLLERAGVKTIGELVMLGREGCMGIRGFGLTSLASVRAGLKSVGLRLIGDE